MLRTDIDITERIATLTLDRPDKRNALSLELMERLTCALDDIGRRSDVAVVILAASGSVFSSGHDLSELIDRSTREYQQIFDQCVDLMTTVQRIPQPVIAMVRGVATAAGCQLVASCDLAIASERARIVPAFGRLGLLPEVGTSWAITRRLGYQGAFAYYARGEQLDAARALELGLVHEVVAHEDLLATADDWCTRIAALPAHAIAMTKPLLRAAADASWDHALTMEEFAEPQCFTTQAFQDSVTALMAAR